METLVVAESLGTPPHVMHVLPSLENGGLQRSIFDLVENVPDIEMSIAAVNFGGDYQEEFEKRCPTIVLGDEEDDPHRTYSWFMPGPILNLAREIRTLRPNIVQTHTFAAATIGRTAAKLAGVPVVIDTLHNTYTWKGSEVLRIDRTLAKLTDKIVCVSNAVKDYAISQNPKIPATKYEVIHNGVDTDRYYPRANREEALKRFAIPLDALVVGSVSRLVKQKRTRDLVAAAPRVLEHFPSAHFLIAGDGPMAPELKEQVKNLSLEQSFTFTGTITDSENIYPVCDVLAQTAEREGFGLSLAEAMASGVACVAANTGAIPELVHHNRNGLLYGVGDVDGLANSICKLLGNPIMRSLLGVQAVSAIRSNFNIALVPNKYRELWCKLLLAKA